MNVEQHYYLKLAEESLEVAHAAIKTILFGIRTKNPFTQVDNQTLLHQELNDVQAVVEELNNSLDFNYQPSKESIEKKKAKMLHYLGVSSNEGQLHPLPSEHPDFKVEKKLSLSDVFKRTP